MHQPTIAIILPAYNEELTISTTIESFFRARPDAQLVVIDNRSNDRTTEVTQATFARLGCKGKLLREPRPGKGNAVRKAFREIQADIYVMADADSTYLATDLEKMLGPILRGEAEITTGDRHADATYRKQNTRRFHNVGNNLVRGLINLLFRANLHDILSGYRVMSYRFVKSLPILSEGFELETEMTLFALDKRFPMQEISIGYVSRPAGSASKLNTVRDGIRVLKTILWIFKDYRPMAFFLFFSALAFLLGLAIGIPVIMEFMRIGLVPKFPSAILASGLMLLSAVFLITGLILDTVVKFQRADFEARINYFFPTMFRYAQEASKP